MVVRVLSTLVLVTVFVLALNEEQNTNYITTFPESVAVRTDYEDYKNDTAVHYGRFQCATRGGVEPLWLINGRSPTSIKTTLGYENISSIVYPLPENGSFTLLYIPGYQETNNSEIRCAAVVDGQIVEHTNIVYFTVYCTVNCSVTADIVYTESTNNIMTTEETGSLPMETDTAILIAVMIVVGLVLLLLVVLVTVIIVWFVCSRTGKLTLGSHAKMESNLYWSQESGASGGQVLLRETGGEQDKTKTKLKE